MPNIFVSYARKDRELVSPLVDQLKRLGYNVWWDRHLDVGQSFSAQIEEQLKLSDAILVIWSKNSRRSDWVKDEANYGREKGNLVPISIDQAGPPIGFQQLEFVDFTGWHGKEGEECFSRLSAALHEIIQPGDGNQNTTALSSEKRSTTPAFQRIAWILAGLLAFALVVWLALQTQEKWVVDEQVSSVAVMPFSANSPSTPKYLAESLSEDVSRVLAEFPELRVVSYTSSMALASETIGIEEYGRRLGAEYIVGGNLRFGEETAHIQVRLIRSANGETVWTGEFDFPAEDLASVEQKIAGELSQLIPAIVVSGSDQSSENDQSADRTSDPLAYRDFAQGRALASQRTENGMRKGIDLLMSAVERDPEFADAWAELAIATAIYSAYGYEPLDDAPDPRRTALSALNIDPHQAEALAALGLLAIADRDLPTAIRQFQRAVAKRPGYGKALGWLAWTNVLAGQENAALAAAKRAAELDPLSTDVLANLSISQIASGNYTEGIEQAKLIADIQPGYETAIFYEALGHFMQADYSQASSLLDGLELEWADDAPAALNAVSLVALDRHPEARILLLELQRTSSDPFSIGLVQLALGEKEKAMRSFDRVRKPLSGNGYWPAIAMALSLPELQDPPIADKRYDNLRQRIRAGWGWQ